MPQSIFQGKTNQHRTHTYVGTPPLGWAYIGDDVQQQHPLWDKIPVWNMVGNNWIQLNADLDKVDYSLVDLKHDRVTIDIQDHLNFDFLDYTLTISPMPSGYITMPLPDNTDTKLITGLTEETTYRFDLRANLVQGGQTNPSVQFITTPENPIPKPPVLSYRTPTNSGIALLWTDPLDSSAVSWRVYRKTQASTSWRFFEATSKAKTFGDLAWDTPYEYYVAGVNDDGLEGPGSNHVRVATGHDTVPNRGSFTGERIEPTATGSWRPDIGWYDWHEWPRKVRRTELYQGYWQKDPIWTGSTWGIDVEAQAKGRYRGTVTYDTHSFRVRMDQRYGYGVWQRLGCTCVSISRVVRQSGVGTVNPVYMQWYLTNTNIVGGGAEPPLYFGHRNNGNNADQVAAHDSMGQGHTIHNLRLPRGYGNVLISGTAPVATNGIVLWRGDHDNTGSGAAGYGRWAPHGTSDWAIIIDAAWDFTVSSYAPPREW